MYGEKSCLSFLRFKRVSHIFGFALASIFFACFNTPLHCTTLKLSRIHYWGFQVCGLGPGYDSVDHL